MSSAVLVQTKGTQRSFQPSMKARLASVICLTEVNEALRMAWRVMMEKNDSTRIIQEAWVGMKCRWIRQFFASHFFTSAWLRAE